MTHDCHLLFVYGTLLRRSPHPMARLLAERAMFLGEAKIVGRLYDLGRFPGLTDSSAGDWVFGDLYDLGEKIEATMSELDRYEEAESSPGALFERRLSEVTLEGGDVRQAWVYWLRGDVGTHQRIESGRYLA